MSLALSKVHFKGLISNDIFGVGVKGGPGAAVEPHRL
jgi:hypothetical protein